MTWNPFKISKEPFCELAAVEELNSGETLTFSILVVFFVHLILTFYRTQTLNSLWNQTFQSILSPSIFAVCYAPRTFGISPKR
jgi:hypothetical protein